MAESRDEQEKIIEAKKRRLQKLRTQAAHFGASADPSIAIEIEDLEKELLRPETPFTQPLPKKAWSLAAHHPLQPAPHFAGREKLLADLTEWATDETNSVRVVALVAPGGTGKTAVAERVLNSLKTYNAVGVFVWSFYENPQTETFLRDACRYFCGIEIKDSGFLLGQLQLALSGNTSHLLVLDGLELMQAPGGTGRPRGEVEDPLLKRLLMWLAAGLGTQAKALVTSRFPFPNLESHFDRGYRSYVLTDLEQEAAIAVLRAWGVKGSEPQLVTLLATLQVEDTHSAHALSVSVLGSYLGKLWNGDPTKGPTFDIRLAAGADPKAAKLTRILASYADQLQGPERDLLSRLSMFPRGMTAEIIGYLVDAGGEIAGRLNGYSKARLLYVLEGLRNLGLVFRYDSPQGSTFSAHPFLREFFQTLYETAAPTQIHEAVRLRMAPSLEHRPGTKPIEKEVLDRYERLIDVTLRAGKTQQAFDIWLFSKACG